MNKNIFLGLFMVVLMAFSVSAALVADPNSGTLEFDDLDVAETFDFTLENTEASATLGDFDFSVSGFGNDIDEDNFDVSFPGSLAAGASDDVTITVDLSGLSLGKGTYDGVVTLTNNNSAVADTNISLDLDVAFQNMLEFVDVEWEVEYPRAEDPDDDDGDLDDGDTVDVGEGALVTISGDVENVFEFDMEIQDIEVNFEASNMDSDGDDLEEDENIDDLDDGKDDSFSFEFYVPYDEFDDGDTSTALLWVEGEDENGDMHYAELNFIFEVEKDQEEVTIVDAYIDDEVLSCDRTTTVWVKLKNTGEDDLEDNDDNTATLTIENDGLDVGEVIRNIEMDSDSDDSTNEQTFRFDIDASDAEISSTRYNIKIEAYADEDEESDSAYVLLLIEDCASPTTTTTQQSYITTTTSAPVTTTTVTPLPGGQETGPNYATFPTVSDTKRGMSDSTWYIIVLVIVIVILIVLAIVMLSYVMRK